MGCKRLSCLTFLDLPAYLLLLLLSSATELNTPDLPAYLLLLHSPPPRRRAAPTASSWAATARCWLPTSFTSYAWPAGSLAP